MQRELDFGEKWRNRELWEKLLALLEDAVRHVGLKEAAFNLDEQPSYIRHALAGRNRCTVKAEWIPYLVANAPSDDLAEFFASLRGQQLVAVETLTPEQRLERLDRALDSTVGEEVAELIRTKAFKR